MTLQTLCKPRDSVFAADRRATVLSLSEAIAHDVAHGGDAEVEQIDLANGNSDEVAIRELSTEDEGDGITYLKIEPLHAPAVVYETGNAEPTPASTPVPTPNRFEATGLRYRFLAVDPDDLARCSPIKEWTAKLRLKYQLHDRGDHYEVELLALPKANGITIHYDAVAIKTLAEKLQELVSDGSVRMTIGSLGFATGQDLLAWLKSTNQQFNAAKVSQ